MKEITPEMFNLATMFLNSTNSKPKKIKVTSEFADYLQQTCHLNYLDMSTPDGVMGRFTGIPIVVDDEIKDKYFEIEY